MEKRSWSERLNERLRESPGEIFSRGKWRFWFPLVLGLTLLNGLLTAWIFGGEGLQIWIGVIVATVGALLCWLAVGNLHYSDSDDARLARGVSLLDSITLCFVIAHFCFLLWAQTHLITLRAAEVAYLVQAESFNSKAEKVSTDNVEIARSAEKIAAETTKAERLRTRAAYHQRRAAEAGARVRTVAGQFPAPASALTTAPIELEKPKAPAESSAGFLSHWDTWIRLANFGELILAAVTLIYIRNRSAAFNAKRLPEPILSAGLGTVATSPARLDSDSPTNHRSFRQAQLSVGSEITQAEMRDLRESLKQVSFHLPKTGFKADQSGEGVIVRQFSYDGEEKTIHSVKLSADQCRELISLAIPRRYHYLSRLGFDVHSDVRTFVYFIRRKGTDMVKIGMSDVPSGRLKQLQTASDVKLEIVKVVPGNQGLEQRLHRRFRDRHLKGEWFQLTQADIDNVVGKIEKRLASGKPL